MPGKEFEIARKLMQDRLPNAAPEGHDRKALEPATFREIDGRELARQYVAHRKLVEAESRSPARIKAEDDPASRAAETRGVPAPLADAPAGPHRRFLAWLRGLWRN